MSFKKLLKRACRVNPDGWGAAFYKDTDAYVFREPTPGAESRIAAILTNCGIPSHLVISHIRKATQGDVSIQNTHPFTRELGGRRHSFAFNGDVPDVYGLTLPSDRFLPIGNTDAEYAYCYLLNQLVTLKVDANMQQTAAILHAFGLQLSAMGPANFLYSDSRRLYVFASRRRHPDGEYPPGLHMLTRQCEQRPQSFPVGGITLTPFIESAQQVALFASVPLSDEGWCSVAENQLLVVENGQVQHTLNA